MAATLILGEHVYFGLEAGVGIHRPGLGHHLAPLDFLLFDSTHEETDVVARPPFVEKLAEHLDVGDGGLLGILDSHDFHFLHLLDDSTLNPAGGNRATAFNREHILDGHQEVLVDGALGLGDVGINRFHQLENGLLVGGVTFRSLEGGTRHDGDVITGELILIEQFADFHLHKLKKFFVIHLVRLVEIDANGRHTNLAGQQDVLPGLGHRTVRGGNHQDGTVHLGCTGNHVFHIVGVSGTIDVRVVAIFGLVFHVSGRDGDSALLLLGGGIDFVVSLDVTASQFFREDHRDRRGEGSFSMVDVADRTDVHVGLVPFKLFFGHMLACCGSLVLFALSSWRELNPRPRPYQGRALPLSYMSGVCLLLATCG